MSTDLFYEFDENTRAALRMAHDEEPSAFDLINEEVEFDSFDNE